MMFFVMLLSLEIIWCKLSYVVEIFRHGARNSESTYNGFGTENNSQLTSVGRRQLYNLGRYIRRDYIQKQKFLSDQFLHTEIQILSSQKSRTISSAICHVRGMFEQSKFKYATPLNLNPLLLLPPYKSDVVISIEQAEFDHLLPIVVENGDEWLNQQQFFNSMTANILKYRSAVRSQMNKKYQPFLQRMNRIFNYTRSNPIAIEQSIDLFDMVHSFWFINGILPSKISQQDYRKLQYLYQYCISLYYETPAGSNCLKKLHHKIFEGFDNKISNPGYIRKWTMLSTHDSQLGCLKYFFNISSTACLDRKWNRSPLNKYHNCIQGLDFASNLLIQLYISQVKPYVKVASNGRYVQLCESKHLHCEYQQFKTRVLNNLR